jgi:hypothetical protein
MGKKEERKRVKKKREGGQAKPGIVDVLHCAPIASFHYELVVGNGIGDYAVEDAQEAFRKAFEARRQSALEAAGREPDNLGKNCEAGEHRVIGPFSSAQDWKIDSDAEPMTAMTWCWVGYQSVWFCRPRRDEE